MSQPQIKAGTSITKADLMKLYEKNGWRKNLDFDWLQMINGTPHIIHYRFNADAIQCDLAQCRPLQMSYIRLESTGVIWTCGSCQKTDGPITTELGEVVGLPRPIPHDEAFRVIGLTGQFPPVGLEQPPRGRKFQIIG